MIQKSENCLYCGSKMESITAKKKFCSTKCRIYYNRQLNSLKLRFETPDKKSYDGIAVNKFKMDEQALFPVIEKMPEGLNWKEQLEWKRNQKK